MKYIYSILFCATALMGYAQKAEPLAVSLEEAMALALENNVTIKNATLDIAYAETQVDEIRAQGLPQINGNAGFTHNLKIATQVLPDFISPTVYGVLIREGVIPQQEIVTGSFPAQFGVPYTMQAGVGVNQLLFDGTFFLGLKAASEFVNVSRLSISKDEIDVKEAVKKSYYMALISEQNLSQLKESLTNIQALKDETQKLYEAGFAEKLDVDRIVLSVSNLEISINRLQNQAKLAKQLLLNTMGMDVNRGITLTSTLPKMEEKAHLLSGKFDPSSLIEYQLLEQQERLTELNLKRYNMGYIPSLYGNFNYGGNTFAGANSFSDLGDEWYPISSYGVSLNVPIFDGLYKKAKTDQAKINLQKIANTKEQVALGMSLEISQAHTNYLNALKNIELQEKSVSLAEEIYKTTQIKFKEGVGSSFEMINAESELTQARTNHLNALYQLNVTLIDLEKALGTL